MTQARILLVDDDRVSLSILTVSLSQLGYDVVCATSGQQALENLEGGLVNVIVSDLSMPGMDGLQLMQAVHERHPAIPFIVLTAQGSIGNAVDAIQRGALDYLEKPYDPKKLEVSLQRALEFSRLSGENVRFKQEYRGKYSFQNIVTQSAAMGYILELAKRVSASPHTTISLFGESGCGKEVLARAIHVESGCLPGSFSAINCAAIPESLLESELFGHVKGAFTGAERDREGKFALAKGGTVLLDEIGDMPLSLQAKLLRVLEERIYEKVGSNTPIPADFRVIVATHRNLSTLVREGKFREDLFHRVNVVPIEIPPLRDRRDDIPMLVAHFLNLFRQHQGKPLPGISKKAMDMLMDYSWPGNIRELRNVLEYATIIVKDELIRPEHLRLNVSSATVAPTEAPLCEYHIRLSPEDHSLSAITNQVLAIALSRCGGNKSQAAEFLKVSRKMFYRS